MRQVKEVPLNHLIVVVLVLPKVVILAIVAEVQLLLNLVTAVVPAKALELLTED